MTAAPQGLSHGPPASAWLRPLEAELGKAAGVGLGVAVASGSGATQLGWSRERVRYSLAKKQTTPGHATIFEFNDFSSDLSLLSGATLVIHCGINF